MLGHRRWSGAHPHEGPVLDRLPVGRLPRGRLGLRRRGDLLPQHAHRLLYLLRHLHDAGHRRHDELARDLLVLEAKLVLDVGGLRLPQRGLNLRELLPQDLLRLHTEASVARARSAKDLPVLHLVLRS